MSAPAPDPQAEPFKDKTRFAIYTYLRAQTQPVTMGRVIEGVEGLKDRAVAFRHVAKLVDAGWVEKVGEHPATYRVVEG